MRLFSKHKDLRRAFFTPLIALPLVCGVPSAHATTCGEICPGTGACSFNDLRAVTAGSVLDCSGRDITIEGLGNLKVVDGSLTLIARNLTVDGTTAASGTITAVEGPLGIPGTLNLQLTGWLNLAGKLRANGTKRGGIIKLYAQGNITLTDIGSDGIEALGTSLTAEGGQIYVNTEGSLAISDPILADGGGGADAAGGRIDIHANGNITTDTDGHISAYGRGGGGGEISVSAKGNVVLYEHLKAEGIGSAGDGGSVFVTAGQGITVANEISVMGGVGVSNATAVAGSVELTAGCGGVALNSSIRATGGQISAGDNGGSIAIQSGGPITVSAGVTLDAHALSADGDGGAIDLAADSLITVAGTAVLNASGGSTSGTGGAVLVRGCRLNVASGATLNATGFNGGDVRLGSTKLPSTGTSPLVVSSSAQVHAAGATAGTAGFIGVMPIRMKSGACSNNGDCQLNTDCTHGCETGTCSTATPDTAGVTTQFDVAIERADDPSLPSCSTACGQ